MTIQILCNSDFIFDNHYNHNIIASSNILNITLHQIQQYLVDSANDHGFVCFLKGLKISSKPYKMPPSSVTFLFLRINIFIF